MQSHFKCALNLCLRRFTFIKSLINKSLYRLHDGKKKKKSNTYTHTHTKDAKSDLSCQLGVLAMIMSVTLKLAGVKLLLANERIDSQKSERKEKKNYDANKLTKKTKATLREKKKKKEQASLHYNYPIV